MPQWERQWQGVGQAAELQDQGTSPADRLSNTLNRRIEGRVAEQVEEDIPPAWPQDPQCLDHAVGFALHIVDLVEGEAADHRVEAAVGELEGGAALLEEGRAGGYPLDPRVVLTQFLRVLPVPPPRVHTGHGTVLRRSRELDDQAPAATSHVQRTARRRELRPGYDQVVDAALEVRTARRQAIDGERQDHRDVAEERERDQEKQEPRRQQRQRA